MDSVPRLEGPGLCGLQTAPTLDAGASNPLTLGRFPLWRTCCAQRPSLRLAARDNPACWAAPLASSPYGAATWLGRTAARLSLDGRPQAGLSRAPAVRRRAGLCPHQLPALGRLKTLGRFLTGGSPGALSSTGLGRCGFGCCAALAACITPDALRAFSRRAFKKSFALAAHWEEVAPIYV